MFVIDFTRYLVHFDHEVTVVEPTRRRARLLARLLGFSMHHRFSGEQLDRQLTPSRLRPSGLIGARRDARSCDVVYCKNEPHELLFASLLMFGTTTPLVVGCHSPLEGRRGLVGGFKDAIYRSTPYRFLLTRAKAVHALQSHHKMFLESRLHLDGATVHVVGNGVDLERFSPSPDLPDATHPFRVLFLGRLEYHKGADLMLEAISRAPMAPDMVRFTIAGLGSLAPLARRLSEARADVTYMGHVDQPESCYRAHDLLVHPSRVDMFPMVPSEALACGLPVLLSDIPANLVFAASSAVSFTALDAVSIGEAIGLAELARSTYPGRTLALRKEARAFAETHLDRRRTMHALLSLLTQIHNSVDSR